MILLSVFNFNAVYGIKVSNLYHLKNQIFVGLNFGPCSTIEIFTTPINHSQWILCPRISYARISGAVIQPYTHQLYRPPPFYQKYKLLTSSIVPVECTNYSVLILNMPSRSVPSESLQLPYYLIIEKTKIRVTFEKCPVIWSLASGTDTARTVATNTVSRVSRGGRKLLAPEPQPVI